MKANFHPFPVLHTNRLQLRQLHPADAPEIFIQRSDPSMIQYTEIKAAQGEADALQFIEKINTAIAENASMYWAITLKNQPELIGTICLWNLSQETNTAELGFALNPTSQGKGYMGEALSAVLDYAFRNMEAARLEAYTNPENLPSIRVLTRAGFVHHAVDDGYTVYLMGKETFEHLSDL